MASSSSLEGPHIREGERLAQQADGFRSSSSKSLRFGKQISKVAQMQQTENRCSGITVNIKQNGSKMVRFFVAAAASLLATSAFGADLAPAPVEPISPAVAPFSWTGFYAGLNAGVAWNQTKFDNTGDPNQPLQGIYPFSSTNSAFVGGAQVGYNYQIDNFVLGLEGSMDYTSMNKRIRIDVIPGTGSAELHSKQQWLGAAGLRLGYAFDRFLIYASGGIAFTQYDISNRDVLDTTPYGADYGSDTKVGWTVGAGAEYALTDHWTLGLDYKYYSFGKKTYNSGYLDGTGRPAGPGLDHYSVKMNDNVVTARVSYKF